MLCYLQLHVDGLIFLCCTLQAVGDGFGWCFNFILRNVTLRGSIINQVDLILPSFRRLTVTKIKRIMHSSYDFWINLRCGYLTDSDHWFDRDIVLHFNRLNCCLGAPTLAATITA